MAYEQGTKVSFTSLKGDVSFGVVVKVDGSHAHVEWDSGFKNKYDLKYIDKNIDEVKEVENAPTESVKS